MIKIIVAQKCFAQTIHFITYPTPQTFICYNYWGDAFYMYPKVPGCVMIMIWIYKSDRYNQFQQALLDIIKALLRSILA